MKKLLSLFVMLTSIISATPLFSFDADSVLGTWLVPKQDAKVTIYKCGNEFCGRISWLKSPNDLDENNPDPAKRKNAILGMNMLWGFNYGKGEWVGGHIYDPDSGKTYKCKMWLKNTDTLNVRGYVGFSLLGRSETWTKVQ